MILLGPMLDGLVGKHGRLLQFETAAVYTAATVSGSLFAHFWALRTEKGKSAVGASKLYAQIPVAEWKAVQEAMAHGSFPISTAKVTELNGQGKA